MKKYFLAIAIMSSSALFGQTSEKYNSEYAEFYRAEELFEKEQFGAARRTFRLFLDDFHHPNDPMHVKARYYEAISALELYNNDAVKLLENFNRDYPESIYKTDIYFRLGKFYYYKKKYKDALAWFNRLSAQDIDEEDREEFYFKVGYANFKEKNFDAARDAFYEVKDGNSQYANPSLYYYSHIAYQNEQYQTALNGFLKLEKDEKFGKVVPYYIAQIYYLQGKFEKVTEYADKISVDGKIVNERDMNHLIGDAYYRVGKYDEAVDYLEKYDRAANTTREDDYRLGYSYYKTGQCTKAIRMFDRVKRVADSLGQVAFYHIGECMLKAGNDVSARSAFEQAAFIDKDPVIQEDALYNFALLSYELDINPYDEAVEAFEMYLEKYPNSERRDDVYQYLVNVYTSTNNYEKALNSLDKIPNKNVRLKTAYQLVAFNQGVDRYQKSNFTGAISSFNKVDRYPVDPQLSGKAVYWKADANYRLRKFNESIAGFKKFIGLPSTQSQNLKLEARYNIGYAHLNLKQLEKSIESFRGYIQSNPSDAKKKTDAYMRIADAYFVLKDNNQAIKYYQLAYDQRSGSEDQALFYMARTYGFMSGRLDDKISKLLNIINNYRNSKYLLQAIYEVAESYKSDERIDQAMKYYKQIVYDHPSSNLVVDAKINIAHIHAKKGEYATAEMEYREILEQHGQDQKVCEAVAEGLKDLYISMNQPEKIEQLAAQYACIELDANEQENIYYLPAIEIYNDSSRIESVRLPEAISKFERYLEKFPRGRYSFEVKNYMADCHYRLGDKAKAVQIYRETLDGPNTGFTELAASRVSNYLYNEGQYAEVIPYYKRLEASSAKPEIIFNARLGLMRSNFLTEQWGGAATYAAKVLNDSRINNELKIEANYAKGISSYHLRQYANAETALKWVISKTTTVKAAESRFTLASVYRERGELNKADSEITKLLKMKPAYNYWIAKSLILRTRIYMTQDKLFDAEETLKSVREHYPIQDDGILDEANILWDELMQLKNKPKSITPEGDPIIDINGQGGN